MGEILGMLVAAPRGRSALLRRCIERLQRFPDALVQAATANRIEFLVQYLANLVVGEGKAVVAAAVHADELRSARFVERVEQRVFARSRHRCQLAKEEYLAQGGCSPQRLYRGVA